MTPKSRIARTLRDAVLSLASDVPAGRALVNSGRLSVPTLLADSPLNTPDTDTFEGWMIPGAPMDDAPVQGRAPWLLPHLGEGFTLLFFGTPDAAQCASLQTLAALPLQTLLVDGDASGHPGLSALHDTQGLVARRCDARPGTCYLIRPDQHVAARWRQLDAAAVQLALQRATGH
jgi:3-(3-hydroxy-phenyl)propionate hydroxylase